MHYYEVAPTQIVRHESSVFTYVHPDSLEPGTIVIIEAGRKKYNGIVIREVKKPPYETKPIQSVIEQTPLPVPLLNLAEWLSTYYATHLAITLQTILPRGVQKSRRERNTTTNTPLRNRTKIVFNK